MSTGIPVFKLTEEESSRLLPMEDELHKRVVGQDHAIKALSRPSVARVPASRTRSVPVGRSSSPAPRASGRPSWPRRSRSSSSATRTRSSARHVRVLREAHRLAAVRSPPGYVGYDEGGQLTEKVRRKPFSVVLFDEVEKAHPDIFNSLLQILEDGRLTDCAGSRWSTSRTPSSS